MTVIGGANGPTTYIETVEFYDLTTPPAAWETPIGKIMKRKYSK
jgi:hypothetical protein